MLVDTHAHLDFLENLEEALERAKKAGLGKIITIGTSISSSKKCVEIAEKFSSDDLEIYATCGIHPEDGKADLENLGDDAFEQLRQIAGSSKKVVGIGECGLDFYGGEKQQVTSDREKEFQTELFEKQIAVAGDLDLPLVVHCRNGWKETFEIMTNNQLRGVFHCWTGGVEEMKKALKLKFYISFSGIVTFKNAGEIAEVAKIVDEGQMLVETDSPFLCPEPLRGKKNSPENVRITAEFISNLRGTSLSGLSQITSDNAERVFGV